MLLLKALVDYNKIVYICQGVNTEQLTIDNCCLNEQQVNRGEQSSKQLTECLKLNGKHLLHKATNPVIPYICVIMCYIVNNANSVKVNTEHSVNSVELLTEHPQFLRFFFLPEGTDYIFSLDGSDTLPNPGVFEQVRSLGYIESILFNLIYNIKCNKEDLWLKEDW